MNHLLVAIPNQAENFPYSLDVIHGAIDFIFDGPGRYFHLLSKILLHGTVSSSPLFPPYALYPAYVVPAPQPTPSPPVVRTEDFNTLFKHMTQMIITALNTPHHDNSNSAPHVNNNTCNGCGQLGHYIPDCNMIEQLISEGKCRCNAEGHIVLPGGSFVPHSIPGKHLVEHIEEWHRCNPGQIVSKQLSSNTNTQLIYNIAFLLTPPMQIQSTYVSSSPPLTLPADPIMIPQLTKEEHINALEQELLALHKKQVFDGVEIF